MHTNASELAQILPATFFYDLAWIGPDFARLWASVAGLPFALGTDSRSR
jgi:hypothetical protein